MGRLEAGHVEALRETLVRLRLEAAELRASRERLVLAADADRRRIERDLHEGVQQHLVALAVNLQLARRLADDDATAARELLEQMTRDVQQALDETAQLADRVYPRLLEAGGLAAALRAAAASVGVRTSVGVEADASHPPEVVWTVYLCCLETLESAAPGTLVTISVREDDGALAFDIAAQGTRANTRLDGLRERVEALGGRLTVGSEPDGTRVSGSLPLSR